MIPVLRNTILLLALTPAIAFHVMPPPLDGRWVAPRDGGWSAAAPHRVRAALAPLVMEEPKLSWWQELWARYVLIRPGMTFDELKDSTLNPLDKRTPGTVRTILLTSLLVSLAAIPYVLTNPAVLPRLIEIAALNRIGVTPTEMLEKTGSLL